MSDYIATLPVDDDPIPSNEKYLADNLFKTRNTTMSRVLNDLKLPFVAGLLFVMLSNTYVSQLIRDTIPYAKSSEVSLLIFKTSVFVVLLYLYTNLHLVKKE